MPMLYLSDEDVKWLDDYCGAQKISAKELLTKYMDLEREVQSLRRLNAQVAGDNLQLRKELGDWRRNYGGVG